jgi:hypothetical protein
MNWPTLPAATAPSGDRLLTAAAFQGLADVPPEMEWFANLGNQANRRAYETALKDFMRFTGIIKRRLGRAGSTSVWPDISGAVVTG